MDAVVAFKVYVIKYLLDKGADINAQDNEGCTSLMRAAYGGYTDLVVYLLNKGADKDVKDNSARMAVHYLRTENLKDLQDYLK